MNIIEQQQQLIRLKTAEVGVLRKTLQDVEQKNASDREALEQLAKKQKEVNLAIAKCNVKLRAQAQQLQTEGLSDAINFDPPMTAEPTNALLKEVLHLQQKLASLPTYYHSKNIVTQNQQIQTRSAAMQRQNHILQVSLAKVSDEVEAKRKEGRHSEKLWQETLLLAESNCAMATNRLSAAEQKEQMLDDQLKVSSNRVQQIQQESAKIQSQLKRFKNK